jgi:hypothetical protein
MTPWTNPLDRVPQIRQDWANHIVYGGLLGLALLPVLGADFAFAAVLVVSTAKKVVDFFKEDEPLRVCVGKAMVTALWPATIWAAVALA